MCGWNKPHSTQPLPAWRCPTCSARVTAADDACPICGALVIKPARFGAKLSHLAFGALVVLALLALTFWFMEPTLGMLAEPTPTVTHTLWLTPTSTHTPLPSATPTWTATATETPFCVTRIMGEGDTLPLLAERFQTTVDAIRRNNGLTSDALTPGQRLCIPVQPEVALSLTPPPTATPTQIVYTVQKGDNLGSIAQKFGTSVDLIIKANNLTEKSILQVGQKLVIAQEYHTPTPVPPTPTDTLTPVPPTVTPTVTPTARLFLEQRPEPLLPVSNSIFHGRNAQIVLSWSAVDVLAPDEWYLVHLYAVTEGQQAQMVATIWTKHTSWRVLESLYPETGDNARGFAWEVIVARQASDDTWTALSPPSRRSYFFWY